jgi:hypothetical protein
MLVSVQANPPITTATFTGLSLPKRLAPTGLPQLRHLREYDRRCGFARPVRFDWHQYVHLQSREFYLSEGRGEGHPRIPMAITTLDTGATWGKVV